MMGSKEQEYIDHALLVPDYMREANNFIIDLINISKTSVHTDGTVTDSLSPELQFSNVLFNENVEHDTGTSTNVGTSVNILRKSPQTIYMPMNDSDFLTNPLTNKYSNTAASTIQTAQNDRRLKVVQQLLTTDETSTDNLCEVICSNSRKVLPHKKRISRKLKIIHNDADFHTKPNVSLEKQERKSSYVERLLISSRVRFRCELCSHGSKSQFEFYTHLKQHYEPSGSDIILPEMKVNLDDLGTERINVTNDLCSINHKETVSDSNGFHDVHFPFENFTQNEQAQTTTATTTSTLPRPEQSSPHLDRVSNVNTVNNNELAGSPLRPSSLSSPLSSETSQLLDAEEFSSAEDMLEGVRDKVFVDDTCDALDLITSNSNDIRPNWFNNSCFSGSSMELKVKPFCDSLFNGSLQPLHSNNIDHITVPVLNDTDKVTDVRISALPTTLSTQLSPSSIACTKNYEENHISLPVNANDNILLRSHNYVLVAQNKRESQLMMPSLRISDAQNANNLNQRQEQETNECIQQNKESVLKSNVDEADIKDFKDNKDLLMGSIKSNDASIIIDSGQKSFICKKCLRIFNSSNALKYHNRTHSGLRPHQCDICDRRFFAHGTLKAHMRTHTGVKPYKCEHCDKQFRQWGDLKYHTISIHSTEKAFTCEFCGKSFSRKYSLVVHVRIHTSERNYKCEWCDKSFRASSYLQNHRKIHTGEKPYQCDICVKRFRVSGDLKRHKLMHERQILKLNKNVE